MHRDYETVETALYSRMDLVTLILVIFIAGVVYYATKSKGDDRLAKSINKIPGPLSLPLIGTSYHFLFTPREDIFEVVGVFLRSYGTIMRNWFGSMPIIELMTPENIEVILNNSVQISKSKSYDEIRPWLGDGLLTSTGAKWHRRRKLITPTFHFKILENFMESFVDKSRALIKLLEKKNAKEVFDIYPYITHCALDIICETSMGVEINSLSDANNEYVKAVYSMSQIVLERMMRPWLGIDFIFSRTKYGRDYKKYLPILHDFTRKVINERRRALSSTAPQSNKEDETGKKKRLAFLDLLLESTHEGTALTNEEIAEEVDTFMFEGHDTTTQGIAWSLFLLGNHPEIQEEVYQEIEGVFQGDEDKFLTVNDLSDLKLLERCIKEALRLYPSVPSIGRMVTQDVTIDNYLIPAGCAVNIHIFLMHRDENLFPDPERFDPDRFLPENAKDRHPFAYIPFSAGPRNCIGQKFAMLEEKTVLAYILKKFKVKAHDTRETIKPVMELVLRPLNGVRVTLEPR